MTIDPYTTLVTLMTNFTYNKVGPDSVISVSFYKDKYQHIETHRFETLSNFNENLDANLIKPNLDSPAYEHESGFLISEAKQLRKIYHTFFLFDLNNHRKIIAHDICNHRAADHFYQIHSFEKLKPIPLKRIPLLLAL